MSTTTQPMQPARADRDVRLAWMFFGGTFVALIRNLPAYLLLVVVASIGVWFATRAGMHSSVGARSALIATSLVLLFALSSVTRDASEVVMTTRAATMAWVTFAVDAVVVGAVFLFASRTIRRARHAS
ncbi:MAG: hypothetical protein EBV24_09635 [Actinobacteria bacterium]|nr:hypothetical protein [Actinomycetota bacterium]